MMILIILLQMLVWFRSPLTTCARAGEANTAAKMSKAAAYTTTDTYTSLPKNIALPPLKTTLSSPPCLIATNLVIDLNALLL